MATGSFEKTSWGWQIQQLQKQVGEWVELQFSQLPSALPNWSFPGWSIDASWLGELLKLIVWLLLGLVLLWVGWQLWPLLSPVWAKFFRRTQNSLGGTTSTQAKELSPQEWVQQAQELFRKGNNREACRCLYLAMLQHLNDTGIAPHQPSRTDGEYLQLVQQLPQPQPYQTLMTIHQQLCFGAYDILPETFDQCRQAYGEISNSKNM